MNHSLALNRKFGLGLLLILGIVFGGLVVGLSLAHEDQSPREPLSPKEPALQSDYIPIQGRLTGASGTLLNGQYDITFRLYDVPSGQEPVNQRPNHGVDVGQCGGARHT